MNKKSFTVFFGKDYWGSIWKKIKDFEAEISRKNKNISGWILENVKKFEAAWNIMIVIKTNGVYFPKSPLLQC